MRRTFSVLALIAVVAATISPVHAEYKKTKVAVVDFQLHGEGYETKDIGKFVAEWLITALVRDGRFEVIERRLLEKVLTEQQLGLSGIIDEDSASKLGRMLGAKVVISGSILSLKDQIEVNARIIDVQTGSVIAAESVKSQTAGGLEDLVFQMAQAIIRDFPLEGYVVRRSGKAVIIDLGKTSGIRPGMRFLVFTEGEVIKHPKTGEVLDVLLKETGRIEVVGVMDKTADAVVLSETGPLRIDYGQMIKSVIVAADPQQPQPAGEPATASRSDIERKYATLGEAKGLLKQPIGPEQTAPDGSGRYRHFEGGSIYWSPQSGAWEVHGSIRVKWADLGWERGFLGYPLTDELTAPDFYGRYNHFQGGSIYWTHHTGAWEVHGSIRERWASLGWERSALGYPIGDEEPAGGGWARQSRFEHGVIRWSPDKGAVVFLNR
jgi:TolB-like protein